MPTIPLDTSSIGLADSDKVNPLPPLLHTPHGLAIIEIQGTLNTPTTAQDIQIGRLEFPEEGKEGKVFFYVGSNQRLVGQIKALAKPLAVIARKSDPRFAASMDFTQPSASTGEEELEIIDIVRHKLSFVSRPEFV